MSDATTRQELNLLLYIETCAVDYSGRMNAAHLNDEDRDTLTRWHKTGYVETGRVASGGIAINPRSARHLWCKLSEAATRDAHAEREARAQRLWGLRKWQTTAEKREVGDE